MSLDATAVVQRWTDSYPNRGWRLAADNESSIGGARRYRSADYYTSDAYSEPHLTITYDTHTASSTQFGVDTGHSGYQPSETIAPPLRHIWHAENPLQPQSGSSWAQAPVIVGDRVYSMEGQYQAWVLSARRLSDGHLLWSRQFSVDVYGRGSIAYANGRLFALFRPAVIALAPATGATLWSHGLRYEYGGSGAATSAVVVSGQQVFDASTGVQLRLVQPDDQSVYGQALVGDAWYVTAYERTRRYSLSTGEVTWEHPPTPFAATWDPVVANSTYVVESEFSNGVDRLHISAASNGSPIRTVSGSVPPALNGDFAIVGDGTTISRLNLATGSTSWTRSGLAEAIAMPPAISNGVVYVATTASTGGPSHFYALSYATGEVLWSTGAPVEGCGYKGYFGYGTYLPSIAIGSRRIIVPMTCGIAVYGPA